MRTQTECGINPNINKIPRLLKCNLLVFTAVFPGKQIAKLTAIFYHHQTKTGLQDSFQIA